MVIIGSASEVKDLDEKRAGLDRLVDHIIPGRSSDARPPTEKELRATMLLSLPIGESSAKVRTGWPLDEEEDYDLPVWAGVVPITSRLRISDRRSPAPPSARHAVQPVPVPAASSWAAFRKHLNTEGT